MILSRRIRRLIGRFFAWLLACIAFGIFLPACSTIDPQELPPEISGAKATLNGQQLERREAQFIAAAIEARRSAGRFARFAQFLRTLTRSRVDRDEGEPPADQTWHVDIITEQK